jgi:excisionase family DNA binding protein
MEGRFYTVEMAAELLRLHPKTVCRFIREDRLRASRVGRSYRILKADLDAFAGIAGAAIPAPHGARVTAIVDLKDVDASKAERIARYLPGVRASREAHADPMMLTTSYDPEQRALKIVIVASPADAADMLKLVDFQIGGAS